MRYKLIKDVDPQLSAIQQVLFNRGIKLSDIHHYLNTTDDDISNAEMFGEDRIKAAVAALVTAINNN